MGHSAIEPGLVDEDSILGCRPATLKEYVACNLILLAAIALGVGTPLAGLALTVAAPAALTLIVTRFQVRYTVCSAAACVLVESLLTGRVSVEAFLVVAPPALMMGAALYWRLEMRAVLALGVCGQALGAAALYGLYWLASGAGAPFADGILNGMDEFYAAFLESAGQAGLDGSQAEMVYRFLMGLAPSMLLGAATVVAGLVFFPVRWALNRRDGLFAYLPGVTNLRMERVGSIVYLAGMVVSLFAGGVVGVAAFNVTLFLGLLLTVCGFSLELYYIGKFERLWVRIVLTVLAVLLVAPMSSMLLIVGAVDSFWDLRRLFWYWKGRSTQLHPPRTDSSETYASGLDALYPEEPEPKEPEPEPEEPEPERDGSEEPERESDPKTEEARRLVRQILADLERLRELDDRK